MKRRKNEGMKEWEEENKERKYIFRYNKKTKVNKLKYKCENGSADRKVYSG
jgi:hypothetical protein